MRHVRKIILIAYVLMILCAVASWIAGQSVIGKVFAGITLGIMVAMAVFGLIYNRCPKCGTLLARGTGHFCTHSGEDLEKHE